MLKSLLNAFKVKDLKKKTYFRFPYAGSHQVWLESPYSGC